MEKLLKRGKIDFEICYNIAIAYVNMDDLEGGRENLKKCISLEPDNPVSRRDLGILYLKMNYTDWALDELKKAIELEPLNPENHFNYAMALYKAQEFKKADEYFEKAIELDPKNASLYVYYAENLISEGKKEEASKNLQTALGLEPDNQKAKFTLAKIYFDDKKYSTSRDLLLDIANTEEAEVLNLLAKNCMKLKDFEMAGGIFKKLSKNYPKNHILLCDLARCEIELKNFKQAKETLKQALMIFPDYEDGIKLLKQAEQGVE